MKLEQEEDKRGDRAFLSLSLSHFMRFSLAEERERERDEWRGDRGSVRGTGGWIVAGRGRWGQGTGDAGAGGIGGGSDPARRMRVDVSAVPLGCGE